MAGKENKDQKRKTRRRKIMKRKGTNRIFAAFLLSMLMILSMGMSVFAETASDKNISITNAKD